MSVAGCLIISRVNPATGTTTAHARSRLLASYPPREFIMLYMLLYLIGRYLLKGASYSNSSFSSSRAFKLSDPVWRRRWVRRRVPYRPTPHTPPAEGNGETPVSPSTIAGKPVGEGDDLFSLLVDKGVCMRTLFFRVACIAGGVGCIYNRGVIAAVREKVVERNR